ncbi:MAG: hypothetical protein ACQGVK_03015 [Myxococcota bacterium]
MAWWRLDLGSFSRARNGQHTARAEDAGAASPAQIAVSECCTFRTPAIVLERDSGERLEARFGGLGADEVRLDLQADASTAHIRPLAICVVSFAHRKRAVTSLCRVRRIDETEQGAGARQLVLEIPKQLAYEDLRSARRVATPQGCGLSTRLYDGGREIGPVDPMDLSLSGIQIGQRDDPTRSPRAADTFVGDGPFEIELRLGDSHLRLRAQLRRREGASLAFFFPDALRAGRVEPPEELARIVGELEQRAERLRGAPVDRAPVAALAKAAASA